MGAPKTSDPVSPWVAIQDFAKNVVTLAGALIGFTVTFASHLLGKTDFPTRVSLYVAWGAAVVAIGSGVAAHGFVVRYLKNGTGKSAAAFFSNVSFVALVVAALSFAISGGFVVNKSADSSAVTIAEKATASAPRFIGDKNSKWSVTSLKYDDYKKIYDVHLLNEKLSRTISITMKPTGEIVGVETP
jgi:hypothetical protein